MKGIKIKNWIVGGLLLILIIAIYLWKVPQTDELPDGFAVGNSRIEAIAVDIATKNGGQIIQIVVAEGEWVKAGQVLAKMDSSELEADLRVAEANLLHTQQSELYANAIVIQRNSELTLAQQELKRSQELVKQGHVSKESIDQRLAHQRSSEAGLLAAKAQVDQAVSAIEVAQAQIGKIKVRLEESLLVSPRAGRVLYRLAEPGEILGLGGKVLTILDLSDVYMTLFLPTEQATRVSIGADARIVLDAFPDIAIPAKVSFIAPRSQFTPRAVETLTEREKLMFRIKVKIDVEILKHYAERVKTGVPGMAYVQLDPGKPWPDILPPLVNSGEAVE